MPNRMQSHPLGGYLNRLRTPAAGRALGNPAMNPRQNLAADVWQRRAADPYTEEYMATRGTGEGAARRHIADIMGMQTPEQAEAQAGEIAQLGGEMFLGTGVAGRAFDVATSGARNRLSRYFNPRVPSGQVNILPSLASGARRVDPSAADELSGAIAPRHAVHEGAVFSSRRPTAVGREDEAFGSEILTVDPALWKQDEKLAERAAELLKGNPMIRTTKRRPDRVIDEVADLGAENLRFLFDQVDPEIRARSATWYDGANRIANDRSARYGIPHENVAGVYAALSPQKDWFQNLELGDRLIDIMATKQAVPFTPEMAATSARLGRKINEPAARRGMENIQGRRLEELSDPVDRAIWSRVYDETYNPRSYRVVDPEGYKGDIATSEAGSPLGIAWGSSSMIANAIRAMQADTLMDVSRALGSQHKVRSFATNISNPNTPLGMATSDTHAVAANLLRPLGGKAPEVMQNFGAGVPRTAEGFSEWMGGPSSSSVSGFQGTYPLHQQALETAARSRDVLPRQMQSVTWEAGRELFSNKSTRMNRLADEIWRQHARGKITQRQAQEEILELFGGSIPRPAWASQ